MFLLGDVLEHHESLDVEYKEFCFKTNLFEYYSKNDLRSMIKDTVLLTGFNELIIENIKKYIEYYVPRYISAFHNSKHADEYNLFVGINDFNEITGIPFNGNLLMYNMFFNSYVENVMKSNVQERCCVSVKFETHKSTIDDDILNDDYLEDILDKYDEEDKVYRTAYSDYIIQRKEWIKQMYFYKGKLQDLMNNPNIKMEFVKYLEGKNLLKSFPEVFWKHHEIPSDSIKYVKKSPTHLIYWLIQFKDENVNYLMERKPVEPQIPKILNIEYCLLTKMTLLRKRMVRRGVSYFTILMTFKCNKSCCNMVSFKDPRTRMYRTLRRYICQVSDTPKCTDVCEPHYI